MKTGWRSMLSRAPSMSRSPNGVIDVFDEENRKKGEPLEVISLPGTEATGVAVEESTGDLYVVDEADKVVDEVEPSTEHPGEFKYAGQIKETAPASPLVEPLGVAANSAGDVYVSDGGTKAVDIFGPAPKTPIVVTGPAEEIGSHTATLTGSVDPRNLDIETCQFEYSSSTEPLYSKTVPCEVNPTLLSGSNAIPVRGKASGLIPNASCRSPTSTHRMAHPPTPSAAP